MQALFLQRQSERDVSVEGKDHYCFNQFSLFSSSENIIFIPLKQNFGVGGSVHGLIYQVLGKFVMEGRHFISIVLVNMSFLLEMPIV